MNPQILATCLFFFGVAHIIIFACFVDSDKSMAEEPNIEEFRNAQWEKILAAKKNMKQYDIESTNYTKLFQSYRETFVPTESFYVHIITFITYLIYYPKIHFFFVLLI